MHVKKSFKVPRSRQVLQTFSAQSSSRSEQLRKKSEGNGEYVILVWTKCGK